MLIGEKILGRMYAAPVCVLACVRHWMSDTETQWFCAVGARNEVYLDFLIKPEVSETETHLELGERENVGLEPKTCQTGCHNGDKNDIIITQNICGSTQTL